jgi:hypothetical protein
MKGDNKSNIRSENNKIFGNEKREYLKVKINELETNSKNKNVRNLYTGTNGFKKCQEPRTNLVKAQNYNILEDSCNNLNSRRNYFSQLTFRDM